MNRLVESTSGVIAMSSEVSTGASASVFWIVGCAVAAPLLARLSRGYVPAIVFLIWLGVVVGGEGLGLAGTDELGMLRELGMGWLFLLAGYEVDTERLRGQQGRWAMLTWLLTFAVGIGLALLLIPDATVAAAVALSIAISSTALGALVPILRESGSLDSPIGRSVLVHGAVGELGPVCAMAILLSSYSPLVAVAVLAFFAAVAVVVTVIPIRILDRAPHLYHQVLGAGDSSVQMDLRLLFLLLTGLMALASWLEIDVVLGAFAAGLIVRRLVQPGDHDAELRMETVANSFFVPVFFVMSGISLELASVIDRPQLMLSALLLILLLRGGLVLLAEVIAPTGSDLASGAQRRQLALYAASGLPIIVAVTELATSNDLMPDEVAANLIAAGTVSLLLFPLLARHAGHAATAKAPAD